MALTPAQLDRGLNAKFQQALAQDLDARLVGTFMTVTSTGRQENYGWLENVGTLEEVIDEVSIDGVFKSNQTIINRTYAKAIQAPQDDLDDDQVGGIFQRVQDLTVRGRMFPQVLLIQEIIDNNNSYDNVAFYSAAHTTGDSGVQSNLLTGTGTTLAELKTDFDSSLQAMLGFQDGSGNPIHETDISIRPLVLAPTALFGLFRDLQNAALINNTTNTIQGAFDLVSSSRLVDPDDWFMFNTAMPIKPYVWQTRAPLAFTRLDQNSDIGVLKERFVWKIRLRGAIGPGFWQMAVKTTN